MKKIFMILLLVLNSSAFGMLGRLATRARAKFTPIYSALVDLKRTVLPTSDRKLLDVIRGRLNQEEMLQLAALEKRKQKILSEKQKEMVEAIQTQQDALRATAKLKNIELILDRGILAQLGFLGGGTAYCLYQTAKDFRRRNKAK